MRWKHLRKSRNVEDRRHQRMSGGSARGFKLGGIGSIIIALIIAWLVGPKEAMNFFLSNAQQGATSPAQTQTVGQDIDDDAEKFMSAVLGSTEDIWTREFQKIGKQYRAPKLVLYSGSTRMPGGVAQAASGPFYYPADQTIYIDLSFYRELAQKYKAPGDFAQAYVLAHETAHHVQHLLGLTDKVHSKHGRVPKAEYNKLSVRLELQADYLAGVWAHHENTRSQILEAGDIQEALRAATAIGDDRLQKQATGRVVPDSFTHGTSEQRVRWFSKGARSGDLGGAMEAFKINYNEL